MRKTRRQPPASPASSASETGDESRSLRGRRRFRKVGLSDADYRALGQFRRAIREILAYSQEGAHEHGLTSQQHQALLAIRAHPGEEPMTVGELAECLMIKSHSAVGLVARLEERDLVVRRASAEDRRRALLQLRPRGAAVLEAISLRNLGRIGLAADILDDMVRTVRELGAAGDLVHEGV